MNTKEIVFGGGCFWCLDALYRKVIGVVDVVSGYAGGQTKNPTYEQVCTGKTGHAEVVKIIFDDATISQEKILELFFEFHDPTTLNKQGGDVGTQYRSIIFYQTNEEKNDIKKAIQQAQEKHEKPIVTEINQLEIFYPAEEYHQNYFAKNPNVPYCTFVIVPKLEKFFKK